MKPAVPLERIDAVVLDMDGVITDTATAHAGAWKRLFDEYLQERSRRGERAQPFDVDVDYRQFIDGKARYDGVRSFLASRGITLPEGDPDDPPNQETVSGLGNRKNEYFVKHLREHGASAYPGTVVFLRQLRTRGVGTAVISASQNPPKSYRQQESSTCWTSAWTTLPQRSWPLRSSPCVERRPPIRRRVTGRL